MKYKIELEGDFDYDEKEIKLLLHTNEMFEAINEAIEFIRREFEEDNFVCNRQKEHLIKIANILTIDGLVGL